MFNAHYMYLDADGKVQVVEGCELRTEKRPNKQGRRKTTIYIATRGKLAEGAYVAEGQLHFFNPYKLAPIEKKQRAAK